MQIRSRETLDGGRERLTVVPDSTDDLWHLTHVIEPGDRVAGDTSRRIQRNDEQLRDTGGEREHMRVTIEVKSVEFHRFANRLRIGGTILACAREDQVGHHHTLNVEEYDEIEISKEWKPDQLERVEEATKAVDQPDVAVATVEEGSAAIYTIADHGVDEYASFTGPTGKGEFADDRTTLFDDLGTALQHADIDAVVFAGPGFTKRDAHDHITDEFSDIAETIRIVDSSAGGKRGVHEVLARGVIEEIREQTRIAEETRLLDELQDRIANGEKVAYGPAAVNEAVEFGAVDHLLIVDEILRRERNGTPEAESEWEIEADELLHNTEQQGGSITVFSKEYDPGQQLANLGGIAALLRYRVD